MHGDSDSIVAASNAGPHGWRQQSTLSVLGECANRGLAGFSGWRQKLCPVYAHAGSGAAYLQPLLAFLHHEPFGSSK